MNSRKTAISLLALTGLAVLVLASTPAQAQVVGKMKGTVVDAEGTPLKGAKVFARDVSTNVTPRPAVTSKKGTFIYTSLPPGSYNVWAELDGYMMAMLLTITTGGDGSVSQRDFFYDESQDTRKHVIRTFGTGGSLSLVKNQFEFTMVTPDEFTTVVNRLYAEYRGVPEGEEGEAAAPAVVEKTNYQKGMEFVAAGNTAAAVPFLTLAAEEVEEPGELGDVHYQLGKVSLENEDLDAALASLTRAQEADPTKSGVAFQLARTFHGKGMLEEALEQLEKERALSPDSEVVIQNLATFYADTGDTEQAIATYEELLELNPENFEAYQALAAIYKEAGQRDKEAEVYARMGDKDPSGQSLYNLGNLAFNDDDRDKAKFYYERVIEKNPKHAMAHYQLANTLLGMGDIQGAVNHFEAFADLKPSDPKAGEAKSTAAALKEMLKG